MTTSATSTPARKPLPEPPSTTNTLSNSAVSSLSGSWVTSSFDSHHGSPTASTSKLPPLIPSTLTDAPPLSSSSHRPPLPQLPRESPTRSSNAVMHDDPAQDWVSSASSTSSADARSIQRKTVKREFPIKSPAAGRRAVGSSSSRHFNGSAGGDTTPRRRHNAAQLSSFSPTTPTRSGKSRIHAGEQYASDTPSRRKQNRQSTKHAPSALSASFNLFWSALKPLYQLVSLCAQLAGIVLSPLTSALTSFFLLMLLLTTAYYSLRGPVTSLVTSFIPTSALSLLGAGFAIPRAGLRLIVPTGVSSTYCDLIGVGCTVEPLPIARLARTVSDQALQAHDIFQSVVALGNPANMALHHTEVWELAVAVKATSELENKDVLGDSLRELGDLTRDVKDSMSSLNAQGINSFSWILHEFERIERTIELLTTKGSRYTTSDVARQLDNLFDHLSSDLTSLLRDIESVIPTAARASQLGGTVLYELGTEHARLNKAREDTPLWRRLKDINSFASRQLARDLQLTGDSVTSLKDTRRSLEEARGFLIGYRDQVSYFKAGVVGFHMADHGLDPEDEVATLRGVMTKFQKSVDAAKAGNGPRRSLLPESDEAET